MERNLELIEKSESTENIVVDFKKKTISWQDAMVFGENGFELAQDLIDYDDENMALRQKLWVNKV